MTERSHMRRKRLELIRKLYNVLRAKNVAELTNIYENIGGVSTRPHLLCLSDFALSKLMAFVDSCTDEHDEVDMCLSATYSKAHRNELNGTHGVASLWKNMNMCIRC